MKLKEMAATATLALGIVACDAAISDGLAQAGTIAIAQMQGTPPSDDEQREDESEDLPKTYWQTFKPAFRESYTAKWRASKTDEEKLATIKEELAYQDKLLNDRYKELQAMLPSKRWSLLRDEQRDWLAEVIKVCDDSDGDRVGAADCRLYRTAVRASELDVMIALKRDHHRDREMP